MISSPLAGDVIRLETALVLMLELAMEKSPLAGDVIRVETRRPSLHPTPVLGLHSLEMLLDWKQDVL